MSAWPSWGAFAGGALASNVILAALLHWVRAILEIVRSRIPGASVGALVGQLFVGTLMNAGPWTLLVAAYFAFYISSESWASSFFAGAIAWFTFFGALSAY